MCVGIVCVIDKSFYLKRDMACMFEVNAVRGDVKWYFWVARTTTREEGGGRGLGRTHNFWSKNCHFLFLLAFDPEASNRCNNT